jgi:large subunit ribosomal protein L29
VKANDLREQTGEELLARLEDRQRAVLNFRLSQATEHVENVRAAREARREVARIKTVLRERELAVKKGTQ